MIGSARLPSLQDIQRAAASERRANAPGGHSICDALLAPEPGRMSFEINRKLLAGGIVATDEEVSIAMAFAFRELKLVLEPSRAVALATLLASRIDAKDRGVAVVLSGGNVDREAFLACFERTG